jgi:hypothetical protein
VAEQILAVEAVVQDQVRVRQEETVMAERVVQVL